MATYYFNIQECGTLQEDLTGRAFDTFEAAYDHALEVARNVMSDEVREGRLCVACNVDILNADRKLLQSVPFRQALAISGI
jgi:hypothetical protein